MRLYSIHYLLRDVFKNKWRFCLSILGISTALILMITGHLLIDSYYTALFGSFHHYQTNDIAHIQYISDSDVLDNEAEDSEQTKFIKTTEDALGSDYLLFSELYSIGLLQPFEAEQVELSVTLHLIGTNQNFNGSLLMDDSLCKTSKLVAGRSLSSQDIQNGESVILIDTLLSELMFDGDALNKSLRVPIRAVVQNDDGTISSRIIGHQKFKVIGVCEQSREQRLKLYDAIDNYTVGELCNYEANCYVPFTCSIPNESNGNVEMIYLNQGSEKDKLDALCLNYVAQSILCDISTYQTLAVNVEREVQTTKVILNIGTIILLIISTLLITQTMIFSIKDDLSEYGIKMALGAHESRLAVDIILELIIYGIISFALSFVIALMISLVALNVMNLRWISFHFDLIINPETVLLSFMLSCFTSLLSSIVPISFIAKKSIIDIIKFE